MIFMLQMQYNAPNCMYIFQNCSGWHPGPPFGAGTHIRAPFHPKSSLRACLADCKSQRKNAPYDFYTNLGETSPICPFLNYVTFDSAARRWFWWCRRRLVSGLKASDVLCDVLPSGECLGVNICQLAYGHCRCLSVSMYKYCNYSSDVNECKILANL